MAVNGPLERRNKLAWKRRARRRRSGQTLTEYGLILAYISVVAVQMMHNLAMSTTESMMTANCGLIIIQANNPSLSDADNKTGQLNAVLNYLSTYDYGNFSTEEKASMFATCLANAAQIIANS
jgi:Flp pilus assembly pilin Flp